MVCVACGDGPAARACGGEGRDPMVVERLFFGILRKAVVCFTRLSEVLCMYMEVPIPTWKVSSRTHLHHDPAATVGGALL